MLNISEYMYGNRKYREEFVSQNKEKFEALSEKGQNPKALFIGCVDSRVLPNLMTDTGPGEMLIVRNVGNFVPAVDRAEESSVASALEFAVKVLGVESVIVCGHTQCGAIYTIFSDLDTDRFPFLSGWLNQGMKLKEHIKKFHSIEERDEMLRLAEKESVKMQLDNLMTYEFIQEKVAKKQLELMGWLYDIKTGEIRYYDPKSDTFKTDDTIRITR